MNIEKVVKKMTAEARLFYQIPEEKRTNEELKNHREYLNNLLQKVKESPDKNKRVMEVFGILNDAVDYFDKTITTKIMMIKFKG